MGTIIMMFMLPIGLITYFWDKKNYQQTLDTFKEYILKIKNADLPPKEIMDKIDNMFYQNSYEILERTNTTLKVGKKHFNIGILFIVFGLFNYFGIVGYIIFYKFFLKKRRLKIDLDSDAVLSRDIS